MARLAWDPAQYLCFGTQRTRVVRDLVARLQHHLAPECVRRIIDLGCGPGNSTAVLAQVWPHAAITGLDVSEEMLRSARKSHADLQFERGDITTWAAGSHAAFDLVFSNAALQWVDDHAALLPRLLARVAPGGVLALQIPAGSNAPACVIPRTLAASAAWRSAFAGADIHEWRAEPIARYHDILAPHAAALDLWHTEYIVIHPSAESILEWYRGSGLRPYLHALPDDASRQRFEQEYLAALRLAYPPQSNGAVLFPFLRRFVIARATL